MKRTGLGLTAVFMCAAAPTLSLGAENCDSGQENECAVQKESVGDIERRQTLKQMLEIAVWGKERPDLVARLRLSTDRAAPGSSVEIRFGLENIGATPARLSGDESVVLVRLAVNAPAQSLGADSAEGWETLGEEVASELNLEPRDNIKVDYEWILAEDTAPGAYRLCALTDPDEVIDEISEDNNVRCADVFVAVAPDNDNSSLNGAQAPVEIPQRDLLPNDALKKLPTPQRQDKNEQEDKE